jgi:UDP-N-acetylmuramoylalanine--D-glutamate ligase
MDRIEGKTHNFIDVRALLVGLAREGTALARFLAERGAHVTVTDLKPAERLADRVAALTPFPVECVLGGHPLSLLDAADIVFVSPGVPLDIPLLEESRRRGLPLSSETRLFTRLCSAPVVGITGSSGKTTTTALTNEMLRAGGRRSWIGGNIGQPLISAVEEIAASDVVVMELSSFQLDFFGPWPGRVEDAGTLERDGDLFDAAGWSPPIAAILNITPNHLDRHPSMEAYVAAKAHILAHQHPGSAAVLNLDDAITREMGEALGSDQRLVWFSLVRDVPEGAFLQDDMLCLRMGDQTEVICRTEELQLLGRHNVANTLAACALARLAGAPVGAMRQVATTFTAVEHRLELVREREGVRWYNDSIATTPERAAAALRSFPNDRVVLLAGGRDKHLPWEEVAHLTCRNARHLVLFGEAAELIHEAIGNARERQASSPGWGGTLRVHQAGTLERAVELAARLAMAGDVVLLSPGGTSFDAYASFVDRGEHFRRLVQALE